MADFFWFSDAQWARVDPALRRGVVSISHCWGGLPGEAAPGAHTNLLIATDRGVHPINAMPMMASVLVRLRKATPRACSQCDEK